MKVSIIVPVYNKEEYLAECIESLINQTYSDIEIILVDDESTDSSPQICDEYRDKCDRIKVLHKENSGAAGAWRAGFAISTGDYVMFVDSDDWVDEDMVERLITHATGTASEMILSDYVIERSDGTKNYVYQTLPYGEYNRESIVKDVIPQMWGYEDRRICMSRCMKLISANLIRDNEHYSRNGLRFCEDNALTLPCVMDCERLYIMDHAAMYHYRYVTDSVVHSYDKTLVSSITTLQKITEEMIMDKFISKAENESDKAYAKALNDGIWKEWPFLLMYALKNEVRGNKDGYMRNIHDICTDKLNADIIKHTKITVSHTSNKLLYFVMKHPNRLNCRLLYLAMCVWENR